MTTDRLDALVALTRTIRPDWDTPGIRNAIRQALARDVQPTIAELAYALIRCAENPTVNTPAVVPMDGPHWARQTKDPADVERSKLHEKCGEWHPLSQPCPEWAWMRRTTETRRLALDDARRIAVSAKRPPDQTVERARKHADTIVRAERPDRHEEETA